MFFAPLCNTAMAARRRRYPHCRARPGTMIFPAVRFRIVLRRRTVPVNDIVEHVGIGSGRRRDVTSGLPDDDLDGTARPRRAPRGGARGRRAPAAPPAPGG